MFKGLGNLASLWKQASEIGGKMGQVAEELKAKRVTGSAGGDMVVVETDGTGQVLKVTIDPMLVQNGELEMIQDLLPAAFNSANQKAKQLHMEVMQGVTGGIQLPGNLDETLKQMMSGLDELDMEDDVDGDEDDLDTDDPEEAS